MNAQVAYGLLIPFLGTTLGSGCVFFMRKQMSLMLERLLEAFAAGVMVAASVWSLLIPALDHAKSMGKLSFIPATIGFWAGILILLVLDEVIPHLHVDPANPDVTHGVERGNLGKVTMLVLAVTLHNFPEGMAVGVVLAGWAGGDMGISLSAALALSIGIAIQNFPEGAIISMPLRAAGGSKGKAFLYGTLSGAVEPVAGLLTILFASIATTVLPYMLSFAAGAMIYVVIEDLIPGMTEGEHSNWPTIFFAVGFSLMMILDVALG